MSSTSIIAFILVVLSVIIADIYCANNNAWPKLDNSNPNKDIKSPEWGPNAKTSTTPWPALGSRKNPSLNGPQWVNSNPNPNAPPIWVKPANHNATAPQTNKGAKNPSAGSSTGFINQEKKGDTIVNTVGGGGEDNELREFSEALLLKDTNNAAKYVTINFQKKTTSRSQIDEAPLPLLTIKPAAYNIQSIEKILALYNNYILESKINEVYTAQEKIEETNLLDTVLNTPVMQYTRNFLIQKGKLGRDPKEFKDLLRQIWFNMYSRGQGKIGSSGFEHVFLAEIKNNQVSGLHNWIYFNSEEEKKEANYLGYLHKLDLGDKGAIVKYHFTFHNIDKPVGSMFIGTSPELEMALYTTCFVLRADKICPLKMNNHRFIIRTYTFRYRGKNMIGSAFPEI